MSADVVFTGGPVHLGDPARSRTDAVAVAGDRIVALGPDVAELIGPDTEVVDLAGRLLVPGFVDAHVHPVGAGVELGRCDLTDLVTLDDLRSRIAGYAEAHPDVPWILGGGWSMESFPGGMPDRALLDEVVPDRPMYLVNRDHHGGWVNGRALELAGIDARTPDPADGRIERDADGRPTGMLQEGAMALVARLVPETTTQELVEGLLRAQALLHSLGITGWQDAIVGRSPVMDDVTDAYLRVAGDGLLTARVVLAQWWDRERGDEQIDHLVAERGRLAAAGLAASTVKIMQDGVAENHTAAMLAPYLRAGCGCGGGDHTGLSFVDPVALRDHVTRLDLLDFQVHFHALGDRAVREALDAVEAARSANGLRDTRPHLAHLQVVHPDDVHRFRDLGATANIQPLWAAHEPQMDELTIPFLGPERSAWQYPFAALRDSGAVLAAGSDWPVSSADPIAGLHVAVNRIEPGEDRDPFYPEQRLDVGSALAAYTSGSAYVNHDDEGGRIGVGQRADLAVLSGDLFAVPAEQLHEVRVQQTFASGRRVYAADDA